KIAAAVNRIPRSAATIVPYDVQSRVRVLQARKAMHAVAGADSEVVAGNGDTPAGASAQPAKAGVPIPVEPPLKTARRRNGTGVIPMGELTEPGKFRLEGRIQVLEIRPA